MHKGVISGDKRGHLGDYLGPILHEDGSQSPLEQLSRTDYFEDASQSGARGALLVAISSLGLVSVAEFFFLCGE